MNPKLTLWTFVSLLLASSSHASVLVEYAFDDQRTSPTMVSSHLTTASDFTYTGNHFTFFTFDDANPDVTQVAPSGDPQFAAGGWSSSNFPAAYYAFTVGAAGGLRIDGLSFWGYAANPNSNDLDYRVDVSIGGGPFSTVGSGNIPAANQNSDYLFPRHSPVHSGRNRRYRVSLLRTELHGQVVLSRR